MAETFPVSGELQGSILLQRDRQYGQHPSDGRWICVGMRDGRRLESGCMALSAVDIADDLSRAHVSATIPTVIRSGGSSKVITTSSIRIDASWKSNSSPSLFHPLTVGQCTMGRDGGTDSSISALAAAGFYRTATERSWMVSNVLGAITSKHANRGQAAISDWTSQAVDGPPVHTAAKTAQNHCETVV